MADLPLIIVAGDGPVLFGRNWLQPLGLDLEQIQHVNSLSPTTREDVLRKHEALFRDELGCLKGQKVHINVSDNAKPKFCKARPVPFATKAQVEAELQRLESTGVIERVTSSRWASPIVPVVKSSGGIRICGEVNGKPSSATRHVPSATGRGTLCKTLWWSDFFQVGPQQCIPTA